jgi:hypothetical protein
MAQSRNIYYLPGQIPSLANPFPAPLTVGQLQTGNVDSLSTQRKDLMGSSHFYTFTAPSGPTAVRLDISPAGDPTHNDLDLYVEDLNGNLIAFSNFGGNVPTQLITAPSLNGKLKAGATYIIEVRSYYTLSGSNKVVYNSGNYKLQVLTQ